MTERNKKIIEDAEKTGIPIMVFVAKDANSVDAIYEYFGRCEETNCNQDFIDEVYSKYEEFVDWQLANKSKVKLPD